MTSGKNDDEITLTTTKPESLLSKPSHVNDLVTQLKMKEAKVGRPCYADNVQHLGHMSNRMVDEVGKNRRPGGRMIRYETE